MVGKSWRQMEYLTERERLRPPANREKMRVMTLRGKNIWRMLSNQRGETVGGRQHREAAGKGRKSEGSSKKKRQKTAGQRAGDQS